MLVARVKAWWALALVALARAAAAHVAPSPDLNNRYLKATLLPDGVRLAYTVIFGERPGAAERRRMDADGDGRLDAGEVQAFGAHAAAEIAPRLLVVVDGRAASDWRVADVGVGEPGVAGGAFSVDLVLRVAFADPRAAGHVLTVSDGTAIPLPGEEELRIDESPGVRILESHLAGERTGVEQVFTFSGNPDGRAVEVRFAVDAELRPAPPRRTGAWLAAAAAVVLLALVGWRIYRKVYG